MCHISMSLQDFYWKNICCALAALLNLTQRILLCTVDLSMEDVFLSPYVPLSVPAKA